MACREREGLLNFGYINDARVVDKKEQRGMMVVMMWRIQVNMTNLGYDLPDCV